MLKWGILNLQSCSLNHKWGSWCLTRHPCAIPFKKESQCHGFWHVSSGHTCTAPGQHFKCCLLFHSISAQSLHFSRGLGFYFNCCSLFTVLSCSMEVMDLTSLGFPCFRHINESSASYCLISLNITVLNIIWIKEMKVEGLHSSNSPHADVAFSFNLCASGSCNRNVCMVYMFWNYLA